MIHGIIRDSVQTASENNRLQSIEVQQLHVLLLSLYSRPSVPAPSGASPAVSGSGPAASGTQQQQPGQPPSGQPQRTQSGQQPPQPPQREPKPPEIMNFDTVKEVMDALRNNHSAVAATLEAVLTEIGALLPSNPKPCPQTLNPAAVKSPPR